MRVKERVLTSVDDTDHSAQQTAHRLREGQAADTLAVLAGV